MRRYDEPVTVRCAEAEEGAAPVAFLWRRRLWRILDIERCWRETADWWNHPGEDLLAESEVFRVVASPGRSATPGVYELAHPVAGEEWLLRAVMD